MNDYKKKKLVLEKSKSFGQFVQLKHNLEKKLWTWVKIRLENEFGHFYYEKNFKHSRESILNYLGAEKVI